MLSLIRHQSPSSDVTVNPTFQKETSEYKLQIDQRNYDLSEICLDHFNLAQQNSTTWVLTCLALLDKSAMKRSKYFKYLGKTKKEQKKQQHYSVNCCQHKCEPRSGNFHLFFWSFLYFFCTHWQYVLGLFFEAKPLLVLSNFGGGPFEGMYREVFRDNIPSTLSARETLIARQKSISLKKLFSGFERKLK